MKKICLLGLLVMIGVFAFAGGHTNFFWDVPARNSSESMPCGGGDIGLNVWVEDGDILFYISQSGAFDEHNTLLKQGRIRLRLSPNPFLLALPSVDFRQELRLSDGSVEIKSGGTTVRLWVDVFRPVVHLELDSRQALDAELSYENWRYRDRLVRKGEGQQNSYKWTTPAGQVTTADKVYASGDKVTFCHRNPLTTIFDVAVTQQGMEEVKDRMTNPLKHLTSGGMLLAKGYIYKGTREDEYAGTDYRAWTFATRKPMKRHEILIALHTAQTDTQEAWGQTTDSLMATVDTPKDRRRTQAWWREFWNRSYVDGIGGEAEELTRNYTLFRYMLACNAHGAYPTKFNGGLFTFDPVHVDPKQAYTPDYRKWGGGTMTAQNQRLVYWPMLKNGDFDLMAAQFDTYLRMLLNAELRSEVYWQHGGGCFAEQIEIFGLPNPAEYGFKRPDFFDKGVEFNAWLEYEWDTVLEFCQMILEMKNYAGADISKYIPLIESSLDFFDQHYRYLASRRGRKDLDEAGHLILFPGSACETYKMTNNASSTIAALRTVLNTYGGKPEMLSRMPDIPLRTVDGRQLIAPAKTWERVNNTETPQLYPVFPWRIYGVGGKDLELARNTYLYDPDAERFRSHVGWKQDNIWAACLGLTEEAAHLARLKLKDGPYRFPAFWGPGFDWSPDHNWGGSGMIGLQEMLLQERDGRILLFPAWPKEWDIRFKLHASRQTTVEAEWKGGRLVSLKIVPESRRKDVEVL